MRLTCNGNLRRDCRLSLLVLIRIFLQDREAVAKRIQMGLAETYSLYRLGKGYNPAANLHAL
jgi:hypothetical protein